MFRSNDSTGDDSANCEAITPGVRVSITVLKSGRNDSGKRPCAKADHRNGSSAVQPSLIRSIPTSSLPRSREAFLYPSLALQRGNELLIGRDDDLMLADFLPFEPASAIFTLVTASTPVFELLR
jgi:hypothetical protein